MFKESDFEKLEKLGFEVKKELKPKWKPDYQKRGSNGKSKAGGKFSGKRKPKHGTKKRFKGKRENLPTKVPSTEVQEA